MKNCNFLGRRCDFEVKLMIQMKTNNSFHPRENVVENRKRPTLWRFPKVQVISHHGQITGATDAEETEENEHLHQF